MNHFKLLTLLVTLCSLVYAQNVQLYKISVEEKANGTLIRIGIKGNITPSQITAWTSDSRWLYVTLMGGNIDTTSQWPFIKTGIVSEFQAHQFNKSVQLDFRLSHEIESFEINTLDSNNEVVISLRSPLTETYGTLNRLKDLEGKEVKVDGSKPVSGKLELRERFPYALMVIGGGFITVGLLQPSGVEFAAGTAIFVTGYFLVKKAGSH